MTPAESLIPQTIQDLYEIHEWRHASAVLKHDFPKEWKDIMDVLSGFRLKKSAISIGGGNKSDVSRLINSGFYEKGWKEEHFDTKISIDSYNYESPTHSIDCYRNGIVLEIEWNNKDPFFDRDLNNFRLLFELRVVSVGIIITRCDDLQDIFKEIGRGPSFGMSTTHMMKLLPKVKGGGGGGCPILVFGITKKLYDDMS